MSNENPLEFQDSINVSEALAEAVYSVNSDRKIINTLASSTIRLAESIPTIMLLFGYPKPRKR